MTNFYLIFANYIFLQSAKPVIKYIFASRLSLIRSSYTCVALAEYSGNCSNVFYWVYFCFPHDIILKEDGNNIKCKQTPCHSRPSKPILKILSIYRKNILGKQPSLAICSEYVFRLLHAPKIQIFSTKLNMMVKVVKLFAGVRKHLCRSLFFNKVSHLQTKERLLHRCFTNYFRTPFLQNIYVLLLPFAR